MSMFSDHYEALVLAVQEVVTPEQWEKIKARAEEINNG